MSLTKQYDPRWSIRDLAILRSTYHFIGRTARHHAGTLAVLLLALVHGAMYLVLVPPWQHYDEPTHFEYAWLIANNGRLPYPGEMNQVMRREVAASMLAHNFYWNSPKPNLLTDKDVIEIGISELVHPPAYYILVSLPLSLVRYLDITTQLYVARSISLILFIITIAVALGLMQDLVDQKHLLRWSVPLALALLPPFVDIMTAVNNDVGSVAVFSIFLWLSVRIIRYGGTWRRAALLLASAFLAAVTKNTASVAILLLPVVLLLSLWIRQGWRWRWLGLMSAGLVAILMGVTLTWGDAAIWYRDTSGSIQAAPTRAQVDNVPLGTHVLQVDAPTSAVDVSVFNPLLTYDVQQIAGTEITAGGWIWSSRPTESALLSINYSTQMSRNIVLSTQPLTLTTTPTFINWSFHVPKDTVQLQYRLTLKQDEERPNVRVYLDGAVIVPGRFTTTTPPMFRDERAAHGQWANQPIKNLIRNGSMEDGWPRLQVWVDQALVKYARRSPQMVMASFLDIRRTGKLLLVEVPSEVLFSFFGTFGWGIPRLVAPGQWLLIFQFVAGVAVLGVCRGLLQLRQHQNPGVCAAIGFLGLAGAIVWGNVILRVLPYLDGVPVYAIARYGFPAAIPAVIALVGGWWALVPKKVRPLAVAGFIIGLVALDVIALDTIRSFYKTLPS